MQYSRTCSHCGERTVAYAHRLSRGQVEALKKLINAYTGKPVKLKDLHLTVNAHNNFQKLKHHDLVMHSSEGYVPTPRAFSFVSGKLAIRDVAVTYRNKVVDESHPAWHGVRIKHRFIHDYIPVNYQKKEDFNGSQDTQQDTEHLRQGRLHFAH